MKILVLSWRDPKHPLAGGAEQSMHEHMKGWAEAGHNVVLFSSFSKNNKSNETIDGVEIIRSGNQYLGVQIKAFFYYFRHRKEFDLVVDQFHGIPFFTPLYVNKPKLAVLQEVAKEVWFKNPLKFPLNLIVGFIGYITEPLIYLCYKKIKFMVGSDSAKNDLIELGIKDKNVTVVPHGVILPKFIPKHVETSPMTITYFGPLTADKGILDALKVFSILSITGKYQFCVIGRPETESYYKKVIKFVDKYKLNKSITFYKRPSDKEKFEILAKSFLLLNPSVREGWGLVNIEANVVGTPIIAYPSQGLVDSVKDGLSGVLTKNSIAEDMAKEVEKLIKDKIIYQKLSIGAKKWAGYFDWQKSKIESQKLINNIVSTNDKSGAISNNYSEFNPVILNKNRRIQIGRQIVNVLRNVLKSNSIDNTKVLDIGCATGVITKLLADNFGQTYGIDLDKEALKIAIKDYSDKKNLIFKKMNAEEIKFPSNYFDVVVANQIYYCSNNPKIFFDEIYRVLKSGGICFLGARNKYTLWDAQYHLPLLAFMPRKLADLIVKMSGKSNAFDAQYRSYTELSGLVKKFELTKYTTKILKNPKKYDYLNLEKYSFLTKHIPVKILEKIEPLLPNFIWILKKP